jgi:hypothetical protein
MANNSNFADKKQTGNRVRPGGDCERSIGLMDCWIDEMHQARNPLTHQSINPTIRQKLEV